jgi:hypothetical protein
MNRTLLVMALFAGVSLGCLGSSAQAAPQLGAASLDNAAPDALLQDVAIEVRFYRGHRYCFYFDGWHGAGWYRCGWAWRRGFGWGGVYGWNGWEYGPAAQRFGGRGFEHGDRFGNVRGGTRGTYGTRSGTTGSGTMGTRNGGGAIQSGPTGGGSGAAGMGGSPGGGGPGAGGGMGGGGGGGGGEGHGHRH